VPAEKIGTNKGSGFNVGGTNKRIGVVHKKVGPVILVFMVDLVCIVFLKITKRDCPTQLGIFDFEMTAKSFRKEAIYEGK